MSITEIMNWNNLKNMKCPKCGKPLIAVLTWGYKCTANDFEISGGKFDSLVNKMYQNPRAQFNTADNSESLNNLGHEKVTEDFSDSNSLYY